MKIAIVRGENLNEFEMQNYSPLVKNHQLVGYSTYNHNYGLDVGFPVKKLHTSSEYYTHLPSIIYKGVRALALPYGYNDRMLELESNLKDFDIVHSAETYNYYSLQCARSCKKNGNKMVLTCWENLPFNSIQNPLPGINNKKIVQEVKDSTDVFLAITERAKDTLIIEGIDESRIKVIPMGVDLTRFKEACKYDTSFFMVLCTARLIREKGLYELVYAAYLLQKNEKLSNIKILVIGDGPERQNLQSLIDRLGLKNITLLHSVSYQAMPSIYHKVDAFILPSSYRQGWQEQYGMSLVEAMACSLPVITTISGSIPEVVGDSALLIQPGDFKSIYESIIRLYNDKSLRKELGNAGRKRAEQNYNCINVAKKIEKVYEELV
jgi:glycosyltransferase involved in cell wall biosynthesis